MTLIIGDAKKRNLLRDVQSYVVLYVSISY